MTNNGQVDVVNEMKVLANIRVSDKAHRHLMTVKGAAGVSNIGLAVDFIGAHIDPDSLGNLIRHGDQVRIVFQPPKDDGANLPKESE